MTNVLLLEPNSLLMATYAQWLRTAGCTVAGIRGAQAAINVADQQRPDVVILELQLAAHSGIEFLHEFRSYPEWQTIPVIVHTMIPPARLAGMQDILTRDLGVTAVLYKPRTTLADLLQAVQTAAPTKTL